MSSKPIILVPATIKVFRDTFTEYEAVTDEQLNDVARLFSTMVSTLISHPDALAMSMISPDAFHVWLSNMMLGAMVGPMSRKGVIDIAKAAELVAEIESKGDGEEGLAQARAVAKGFWGQD